jgi:hypothetical protein
VMSRLCLVLGLGASKGHVRIAILASLTSLGICGWEKSLSIRIPLMSWASSIPPPVLPCTLIRSKLTSFLARSATFSTALTAISASFFLSLLTTLDPREIIAASTSSPYSFSLNLISSAIFSRCLTAISTAVSKPSAILRGWRPILKTRLYPCQGAARPAQAGSRRTPQRRWFRLRSRCPDSWRARRAVWRWDVGSPSFREWWLRRW